MAINWMLLQVLKSLSLRTKPSYNYDRTSRTAAWTAELSPEYAHPLSDEFIDYINSVQNLWTAGRNFHPNTSMEYLKGLQGVKSFYHNNLSEKNYESEDDDIELPDEFDARKNWPKCKSLSEIRDQGHCGNCWAISTASAMTDRYCIHSEGNQNFHFSTVDLQSCTYDKENGCSGGSPFEAFNHYKNNGVVSGGNYNSSSGCRPYPYRHCNHIQATLGDYPNCSQVHEHREQCTHKCITKDINYESDLKKGKTVYSLHGEKDMMAEIYTNGPVVASFIVFSDFLSYKSGVYKYTAGDQLGGHAVKIIGWGVEGKVKYWLVANSWDVYWGDNGYFKIVRGENNCQIEDGVDAGLPSF